MSLSADDFMNAPLESPTTGDTTLFSISQAERTSKKDYRAAYIYYNVTSYSQREYLHDCPRLYQIYKTPSASGGDGTNIHFVFGHSVGAGIQTYLVTRNKSAALFASFLAWNTDLDAEHPNKGKNSSFAVLAVEKFCRWWEEEMVNEWEIAYFNGKPATELTFFLNCENGFYHAGHIDAILRHKRSGRYMVLEIKTTAIRNVDEAQYGNSEQPLGYSLILDKVAGDLNATASFQVLYLVYSSTLRQCIPMPFTKSRDERIEWLQDLLLDHGTIATYKKLNFFPKRGDACWSFGGRCSYYGLCDLQAYKGKTAELRTFDRSTMELPEPVDFEFTLSDITKAVMMSRVEVIAET